MVMSAALAIVFALAPRALSLFFADAAVWRIAASAGLLLGGTAMSLQIRQQFRMSRDEAAKIHWLWHGVAWLLGMLAGVFFILALVDAGRSSAYFVAGVSTTVLLSLTVFTAVVFRRFF
jgi:preprotein translocase subunit SecE